MKAGGAIHRPFSFAPDLVDDSARLRPGLCCGIREPGAGGSAKPAVEICTICAGGITTENVRYAEKMAQGGGARAVCYNQPAERQDVQGAIEIGLGAGRCGKPIAGEPRLLA